MTHLRACSAVLAMRPEDGLLAQKILSFNNVKNMRLGVDKELFVPNPAARTEVDRDYRIEPGKFLVLFVGRVDAGKNIPLLIQACARALKKGANLHLAVVGAGPLSKEVKAVLGKNVTLTGLLPLEKLAAFYAAADCLSMVSDIEIGGLVAVEALSCGCPVLTSKLNGVARLYGPTSAIEEVSSDAVSWANVLSALARDKERSAATREAALVFRREKLAGWDMVLKEDFLPVWQNVAQKGAP